MIIKKLYYCWQYGAFYCNYLSDKASRYVWDCSCEKLAEGMGHVFELGYASSTGLQRKRGKGMEYYTEVAYFFEKIK